jgi:hypothetical protein
MRYCPSLECFLRNGSKIRWSFDVAFASLDCLAIVHSLNCDLYFTDFAEGVFNVLSYGAGVAVLCKPMSKPEL